MNNVMLIYALMAACICALVSFVELLDRFTHSVHLNVVICNVPAFVYLALNFLVGIVAVYVASIAGVVDFDAHLGISAKGMMKAGVVGFAGLAVLRSSVATLNIGGNETPIGPSAFLDRLKEYLDGKIDQYQKRKVGPVIAVLMSGIDPVKAKNDLPALCVAGLKRCTKSDVESLTASINDISAMQIDMKSKNILIGNAIYLLCGIDVLKSSITQLDVAGATKGAAEIDDKKATDALSEDLTKEFLRLKDKS